jgi:hypothetical protein
VGGGFLEVGHQEGLGEVVGLVAHGQHHAGLGDAVIGWLVPDGGSGDEFLKLPDPERPLVWVGVFPVCAHGWFHPQQRELDPRPVVRLCGQPGSLRVDRHQWFLQSIWFGVMTDVGRRSSHASEPDRPVVGGSRRVIGAVGRSLDRLVGSARPGRDGGRRPSRDVSGELHCGASHRLRCRLVVGLQCLAHGAQEPRQLRRQLFVGQGGRRLHAEKQDRGPAGEGISLVGWCATNRASH